MQLCVSTQKGVWLCAPKRGQQRAERETEAGVGHRSGSCSVMYTENLAIYVISVCDFNQRQSWGTSKITQHLLKKESERRGEREEESETPIGTVLQHRLRPRPQGGRRRHRHCLGAFQISWHPVWVRFCSGLNFN